MRLDSIQLKNYRQYTNFERTFCGNLIGIIGHNGSGKSHLLEAIHFALVGEVPGSIKAKLLKWSTGIGFVKMVFTAHDETYTVTRNLHDSTALLTTVSGTTSVTGISNVTAKIMEILDVDKDILRQSAFVRQAEIDTVLFTEPKIRELAFQKLCGISSAHKIHGKLGGYLTQIPLQYNYEDQIVEAKTQLKELHDRFENADSEISSLQSLKSISFNGMDRTNLNAQYDKLVTRLHSIDNLGLLSRENDTVTENIVRCRTELQEIDSKIKDIDVTLIQAEIDKLKLALSNVEKYSEAKSSFDSTEKAISELVPPCTAETIATKKGQELKLLEALCIKKSDYNMNSNLMSALDAASSITTCPICHSTISNPEKLKAEIAQRVTELQLTLSCESTVLDSLSKSIKELSSQFEKYNMSMSSYRSRIEILKKTIDSFVGMDTVDRASLRKELTAMLDLSSSIADMESKKNKISGQLTELVSRQNNITASILKLGSDISSDNRTVVLESISGVKDKIEEYNQLELKSGELAGVKSEVQKNIETLSKSITQLEEKLAKADVHRQALSTLGSVREWFHYSNGPHHIASLYLNQLTRDTNKFLDKFSAKFIVIPDAVNLGFNVIYTDGRPMPLSGSAPAEDLSGGEKVSLALSFRFANYCLFASKLGLLSLDEPTVFLDKDNVVNFCSLMETIKTIISNMGIQILISTHEENVIPYLDDVINLNTLGETNERKTA